MRKPQLPAASALTGEERVRVGQNDEARLATTQQIKEFVGVVTVKGEKGDKGDAGVSIKGDKGDPGASIKGDKGDPGVGVKGDKGDPGASIKGDKGDPGGTLLGSITISENIAVAIGAGVRRVTLTTPAAWGVVAGQNLMAFPTSVPSTAYAVHDVIATGANTISVAVSTPALALLATYSITCRLVRINA